MPKPFSQILTPATALALLYARRQRTLDESMTIALRDDAQPLLLRQRDQIAAVL